MSKALDLERVSAWLHERGYFLQLALGPKKWCLALRPIDRFDQDSPQVFLDMTPHEGSPEDCIRSGVQTLSEWLESGD